jgi:protein-tyrosine-phosphatase
LQASVWSPVCRATIGEGPGAHGRTVSAEMLEVADLVLAMSPRHIAELRRFFGDAFREHTSPDYYAKGVPSEEGVPDPQGAPWAPTGLP